MRTERRSAIGGSGLAAKAFAPASCPKQLAPGDLLTSWKTYRKRHWPQNTDKQKFLSPNRRRFGRV